MSLRNNKWLSSDNWVKQTIGALCEAIWSLFGLIFILFLAFWLLADKYYNICWPSWCNKTMLIVFLVLSFICICKISRRLMPIFSLRKEEGKITICQICILLAFGIMIFCSFIIIDVEKDSSQYVLITVIGGVLGIVFKDTIKGVAAFFYLRSNDLIHIGDWIEINSKGIEGTLKMISLSTSEVENGDTSTSAFPTYLLLSEHFKNYQKVFARKTLGRKMSLKFILDIGMFHTLSEEEAVELKNRLEKHNQTDYLRNEEIHAGKFNIELYRKYLYHWLMHHQKISQKPFLFVSWEEQTSEGLPLRVYAFITETSLESFKWQQAQIIEHIITSLDWFDLRLYQRPSGNDIINSNINISRSEVIYGESDNYEDRQ